MYSSKDLSSSSDASHREPDDSQKTGFPQVIFSHNLSVQSSKPQKMALDVASLTLDDSQASLASMPEELWRKIGKLWDSRT